MAELSPIRRLLKRFHPEGIPWPGSVVYNAISQSKIFQRYYDSLCDDILSYHSGTSVLDIGTGPGWLLVKLHEKSPTLQLTGLDASSAMVTRARENLAETGLSDTIEVREGNADNMPFPDDSFDTVVSTGSIHHWKEPTAGLNEVYRVLRHGGYALMYDLASDTPSSILRETVREFGRLRVLLFWLHSFEEPFYSAENFELLARPTQFKEGQTRFVGAMCCLILKKDQPESAQ